MPQRWGYVATANCQASQRTYAPLNPNRCLRAGFYDIEQVRIGDVFLLVSQDDEAAVGHLQLLSREFVPQLSQASIQTVAPRVFAKH